MKKFTLFTTTLLRFAFLFALLFLVNSNLSAQEICGNGLDDDGDLLVDCKDPACHFTAGQPNCNCPVNNVVWFITSSQGHLWWIDLDTGVEHFVGSRQVSPARNFFDVAWGSNGNMYAIADNWEIYQISSNDGTSPATSIMSLAGFVGGPNALVGDGNGWLYTSGNLITSPLDSIVVLRFDPAVGVGSIQTVAVLPKTPFGTSEGDLAFVNGDLYLTTTTGLVRINLSNPAASTLNSAVCTAGIRAMTANRNGQMYILQDSSDLIGRRIPPMRFHEVTNYGTSSTCTLRRTLVSSLQPPSSNWITGLTMFGDWTLCPPNLAVSVNPSSPSICLPGGSASLTASTSAPLTSPVYTWTTPSGGALTGATITATEAGDYTVTVVGAGCCTATTTITVAGDNTPTGTATASPNPACIGQSFQLNAPLGGGFLWSGPDGFNSTIQNPTRSALTAGHSGIYSVTVTSLLGCTASFNVNVTVNNCAEICNNGVDDDGDGATDCADTDCQISPTANLVPSNVCAGGAVQLSATGGGTGATYAWTGPSPYTSSTQNPVINPVTAANQGSYSVLVTSQFGCTATAQPAAALTVFALPNITASANPNPACSGQQVTFTALNGVNYSWTGPNGFTENSASFIRTIAVADAGIYNVSGTDSNGCSATTSFNLSVTESPNISGVASTAATACGVADGSFTLSGLTAGQPYNVSWTGPFGSGSANGIVANGSGEVTVSGLPAGSYTGIQVTLNGCPSNMTTVTIAGPVAPNALINGQNPFTICNTVNGVNLNASGGTSYLWSDGTTSPTLNVAPSFVNQSFTVTVTAAGCSSNATATVFGVGMPGCNQYPVAVLDINSTMVNIPVGGTVLTNDSDPDNDPLTVTLITTPRNGTVYDAPSGTPDILNPTNGNYHYVPNSNFCGLDSMQYRICDPLGLCATTWAYIHVICPDTLDNPPVAHHDYGQTFVDVPVTGNIFNNDWEPDGETFTVVDGNPGLPGLTLNGPSNGTVVINPTTGGYVYTPNTGFVGLDSFTYIICDQPTSVLCDTATVFINVMNNPNPGNPARPFAQDDANYGPINTNQVGSMAPNDFDPNTPNQTLTWDILPVSGPTNGTVVIQPNGSYVYTPRNGYVGPDQFTYSVCNASGLCDTATVYLVVTPGAPLAENDINQTLVNVPVPGNVLTNDRDPLGLPISATPTLITQPSVSGASVVMNPNGSYVYTPAPGFMGLDSFQYQVCNNLGYCTTAWVFINVTGISMPNNPPVPGVDYGYTFYGVPVSGVVTTNDNDPDFDPITVTRFTQPVCGTITIAPNGAYTYTPTSNNCPTDTFTYVVCDNGAPALCDSTYVVIYLSNDPNGPANDPPYAFDDRYLTPWNTPVSGTVSPNDYDPNGDPITFTQVSNPTHGTVVFNTNGTFTYTPNPGYFGPDFFTYSVCDVAVPPLCDVATVYITVLPTPPNGNVDVNSTLPNRPVPGNVLTNDDDPQGLPLFVGDALPGTPGVNPLTSPTCGTLVLNANGSYVYTPTSNCPVDSFQYIVCNAYACDTTWVYIYTSLDVPNQPNPPIAINDHVQTNVNTMVPIFVQGNDFDPDGGPITVTPVPVSLPSNGTVVWNPTTNTFDYTPNTGYVGNDMFTYSICDNTTPTPLCDTATVFIEINPTYAGMPVPPYTQDDANSTLMNTPVTGTVVGNDFNPAGGPLTWTLWNPMPPTQGTVTLGPNGTYTYTPAPGYVGPTQFTYSACNGQTPPLCDTSTVYIVVYPVPATGSIQLDTVLVGNTRTICVDPAFVNVSPVTSISLGCLPSQPNVTIVSIDTATLCIVYTGVTVGQDTFCVVMNGPGGQVDTATIIITVLPNVLPPVAVNDTITIDEDNPGVNIPVTGNDTYNGAPVGNPTVVTRPTRGTVTWNPTTNGFTYVPYQDSCGQDFFTYFICNSVGCDTATVFINVLCDELIIYNAVSPNGDYNNDFFHIENIEKFPNNKVCIYNRWGNLVSEIKGYRNFSTTNPMADKAFDGRWDGNPLPDGTYFYVIELGNGTSPIAGYLEIRR